MDETPWDNVLEGATLLVERLTQGHARGRVIVRTAEGWVAELTGAGRKISLQFARPGAPVLLGDYQLVLIYGCDYEPIGDEGRPKGWGKTLSLREGFHWDEQSLRETVLELLGVFRYVLGAAGAGVSLEDATRPAGVPLPIGRGRLRKKR